MRAVDVTAAHFTASSAPAAQAALARCVDEFGQVSRDEASVVVALGGDGFMLSVLQAQLAATEPRQRSVPVYGLDYGTLGFLMNRPLATIDAQTGPVAGTVSELLGRLATAAPIDLVPLRVDALLVDGSRWRRWAFNEVSLRRTGSQAAALRVSVDGRVRLARLAGDGLLVATPAGSAAYNYSAGGPVLPLATSALAVTGICPIAPRRWPGAVLPSTVTVRVDVLEEDKRPVAVDADTHHVGDVVAAEVVADPSKAVHALFDAGHDLDERLLAVQFPN